MPESKLQVIALDDLIDDGLTEDEYKDLVKDFRCPLDEDLESFLHNKAYKSCKQNQSRTYMLEDEDVGIFGYVTLSYKSFYFDDKATKSLKNKITGSRDSASVTGILIAQLGKNEDFPNKDLKGYLLLAEAESICADMFKKIGINIIMLEHKDNAKLHDFYQKNDYALLDEASDEVNGLKLRYKLIKR